MNNFYYDAPVGNGAFFKRENNRYNYFALYRTVRLQDVKHFKGSSVYSEPVASKYSIYFRYRVKRFHLNGYLKLATPQRNNVLLYSSFKRNHNLPLKPFLQKTLAYERINIISPI